MTVIYLRIRQESLSLILTGRKTLEVRVQYPNLKRVKAGDTIRFNHDPGTDRRVVRVAGYPSFEVMMAAEDPAQINPTKTPDGVLRGVRKIYPPHKEALGALVFELAPP